MVYSLQQSVEQEVGFVTNIRILLADRTKNPTSRPNINGCKTFLNRGISKDLPMCEVNVHQAFQEFLSNVRQCEHVGESDIFMIGSLADVMAASLNVHFAIVSKCHRLSKTTQWSKMSVITQDPICPLTVLFAVKIGSGSHFLRQISAMVDLEIPLRVQYQLGIIPKAPQLPSCLSFKTDSELCQNLNDCQKKGN
ncbi:hypothetical protein GEMRC1_003738 [Eukaryota sp. GEM-RC1]